MKKYIPLVFFDMAAFAVVLFTAWLGNHDSWTTSNLSVVGYWRGFTKWLILWGWVTAVVFGGYLLYLGKMFHMKSKVMYGFTAVGLILLVTGVYIPYQPEVYPLLSDIHIAVSFMAPVCVIGAIITLLIRLKKKKMPYITAMMILLFVLTAVAAVIFVRCTIITTLLEVYVIGGLTVFMTLLACIGLMHTAKA